MMTTFLLFAIVSIYAATLTVMAAAAYSSSKNENSTPNIQIGISVIVALRNEEHNVEGLINSLLCQTYPAHLFEIILVDDHSTDKTISSIPTHPQIKVICLNSNSHGKKAALLAGAAIANFPFLALTDADCRFGSTWLSCLAAQEDNQQYSLVAAPVAIEHVQGYLSAFQFWEFRILQTVTFGTAALGFPTMCNGANLLVNTYDYKTVDLRQALSPSGDDIFLLHHILGSGKKVKFTQMPCAIVHTSPLRTFRELLHQQLRWASKSKYYQHPPTIILGIVTFMANAALTLAALMATIQFWSLTIPLAALGVKMVAEMAAALIPFSRRQEKKPSLITLIVSSIVMPFYATFVATASLFAKFEWKERKDI